MSFNTFSNCFSCSIQKQDFKGSSVTNDAFLHIISYCNNSRIKKII